MKKFNDNFSFKDEPHKIPGLVVGGRDMGDVEFTPIHADHEIFAARRNELGLSQQQVADMAGINLRQYQRYEYGERQLSSTSLRIGLSICDALQLDPHRFI